MPVDAKPLFRPEVLRPRLAAFPLPPTVKIASERLDRWGEMLASGRADQFKESELLPEFLTDIFGGLLGYISAVDGPDR